MKRKLCAWCMATLLLGAAGCGEPMEPDLSAYETAAPAEIPAEPGCETEGKYVALTFDDGPRADTTERLLDGLKERGAKATFFVIGEQIEGNEELLRRMAAEGHQIGNHTYSHARLSTTEQEHVVEEIHKTEVLLEEVVGESVFWLRPPYGRVDTDRASLIKTPMIYWSVDPKDWKLLDAGQVTEAVIRNVQDGDIILLHDFYPTSVDAALRIVDRLQAQGYQFVTVAELFRLRGVAPEAGVLYARPDKTRALG